MENCENYSSRNFDDKFKITMEGNCCIYLIGERFSIYEADDFKNAFLENWHSGQDVVIDFKSTSELDTPAIQILLAINKKVRESDGNMQFINASEEVVNFFDLYNLDVFTFDQECNA